MISMLKKTATVAIALLMSLSAFIAVIPVTSATNDPADTHGVVDVTAEWDVVDTRTYTASTYIRMVGHSVTVKDGGVLTLDHAYLSFDGASDGVIGIKVEKGGKLIMKNGAAIWPWLSYSQYCAFLPGSIIDIDSSTLMSCGSNMPATPWPGVYVTTQNAKINNTQSLAGGPVWQPNFYVDNGGKAVITNSTVVNDHQSGLFVRPNGTAYMADSTIANTASASIGIWATDANVTVIHSQIVGFSTHGINIFGNANLFVKDSFIDQNAGGIVIGVGVKADLINNQILHTTNDGVDIDHNSQVTMKGNTINKNGGYGVNAYRGAILTSTSDIFSQNTLGNYNIQSSKATISLADITTVSGATGVGIRVIDGSNVEINSTIIKAPATQWGVFVEGASTLNIHDSELQDCTYCLSVDQYSTVTADHNKITTTKTATTINSFSTLYSSENTISGAMYAFTTQFGAMVYSDSDIVKDAAQNNNYVVLAQYEGNFQARNLDAKSANAANSWAVLAYQWCEIKMYDSTMSGYAGMYRLNGGHVLSINSTPQVNQVWANPIMGGSADLGYYGEVKTVWQNDALAPNASVKFTDRNSKTMNELTTNSNGIASVEIINATVDNMGIWKHNDYNVSAELNEMAGITKVNVTGNKIGANKITVKIQDTSAPELNITSPKEGDILNVNDLVVSGNFSDNGSGIGGVILQAVPGVAVGSGKTSYSGFIFTVQNIPEGKYHFFVNVTDISGNPATAQVNVTIDRTVPPIAITKPVGLYSTTNTFDLNGTTEIGADVTVNGTTVANVNGDFGTALTYPDGEHRIEVTSTDAAGNKAITTKTVIVDTMPPTMTFNIASGAWLDTTRFVLNGTSNENLAKFKAVVGEAESSMDVIQKFATVNLTLAEGQNLVNVTLTDLAGLSTAYALMINVDTLAPVINVTSPKGPYPFYTNTLNQTITGKVLELNLKSFTVNGKNVSVDANGNFSAVVTLVAGHNHINLSASDILADSFFDVFVECSVVAPVIVITSPVNGFVTKNPTIGISATVTGADPAPNVTLMRIRMRNDQPTRYALDSPTLTEGQNVLRVNATDRYGNSATATVMVLYDNVALLSLTKPTKTKVSTSTPSVTISGTSEPGSKIYINGVMIPSDQSGTFTYKMLVKEGKTTITVKSVDPAGNEVTKILTATRTEAKQFEMTALLGLGIVLMIVGLLIGVLVGRMMAKPKKPTVEEEPEPEETKPAPKEEEEEEPEEEEEEPEEEAPKETKPAPKEEPKVEKDDDDSLDSMLKDLEKGKK
jgi:Na+-transporting methylmalonyl-CoA/oxaloacetate decarboxylase gamma subunit